MVGSVISAMPFLNKEEYHTNTTELIMQYSIPFSSVSLLNC